MTQAEGTLRNGKLRNSYNSANIIRVMEPRMVGWAEYLARM